MIRFNLNSLEIEENVNSLHEHIAQIPNCTHKCTQTETEVEVCLLN